MSLFIEELIEARCAHFGSCGGCRFQNLPYDVQLEQKELVVRELFGEIDPILGCESPWHQRNKMEFSFSENKAGDHFLGLMMRAKRGKVVTLTECHLTSPWFIEALQATYDWWQQTTLHAYFPPSDQGSLRTLTLREGIYTGEKMAVLTISGNPDYDLDEDQIESFVQALAPLTSIIVRKQIIAKKTPTRFEERVVYGQNHIHELLHDEEGNPHRFKIRAPSFFQPNTRQAERLYQSALEDISEGELLLDLYCGTGSIGIFAAQKAKEVIGIEIVPEAVEDAQENIRLNGLQNMRVMQGDVEKMLDDLPQPDTIVVDPPRAGLSPKSVERVVKLAPKKIIYISCNPDSQKKNIDQMEGYRVERVQPVDQFPHTPHIENIVVLRRMFP